MRAAFGFWAGFGALWPRPCSGLALVLYDLDLAIFSSVVERLMDPITLSWVRCRNKEDNQEGEKFLWPWWMNFVKRIWRRMSKWYFGFITFFGKHTYTYMDHTFFISCIDLRPNSTQFSTTPSPTMISRKVVILEITFSGVPSTYPFVHTLEKSECDQEGGGINTGY